MFQKYTDALNLMDALIAVKDDQEAANIAWDKLYTFIYPNFVCPQSVMKDSGFSAEDEAEFASEVQEMIEMFGKDRETLEDELRKIPPVIAEVAFPVYIARHLLWIQKVSAHPSKLTTFGEFHQRYAYMIIKGSDNRRK